MQIKQDNICLKKTNRSIKKLFLETKFKNCFISFLFITLKTLFSGLSSLINNQQIKILVSLIITQMLEYYIKQTEKLLIQNQQLQQHINTIQISCASLIQDTIDLFSEIFPTLPKYDEQSLMEATEQLVLYYQKHVAVIRQCLEHTLNNLYRSCLRSSQQIVREIQEKESRNEEWRKMGEKLQGQEMIIEVTGLDKWTDILEDIIQKSHDHLKQIYQIRNLQYLNLQQKIIPQLQLTISKQTLETTKLSSIINDYKLQNDELHSKNQFLSSQLIKSQAKIIRIQSQSELLEQEYRLKCEQLNTQKELNKILQRDREYYA